MRSESRFSGPGIVLLCDGQTSTRIPDGAVLNRATGQAIASDLMAQWTARNPEHDWAPDPDPAHRIVAPYNTIVAARARELGQWAQAQWRRHGYGANLD